MLLQTRRNITDDSTADKYMPYEDSRLTASPEPPLTILLAPCCKSLLSRFSINSHNSAFSANRNPNLLV